MPSARSILTNWTAGELSPRLYGRVDLAKYQNGARTVQNLIVMPQGGVRKRGGNQYIHNVKDNNTVARLFPFTFSTEQAYVLEVGTAYIRFFKDRGFIYDEQEAVGTITLGAVTQVTIVGHPFVNGDRIVLTGVTGAVELNNREYTVASATSNTFLLAGIDSTTYGAYTGGGTASRILEIATIFDATDVGNLTITQSADTLYLFTGAWPIQTLTRDSHVDWTFETGVVEEGPFLDMNTDDTNTVSLDAQSGTAVMTFTLDTLEDAHTGALFRIWEKSNGSTFGYATWAPGANVTVANNSYWEYEGNVYYVVSGGGQKLSPLATYPRHTRGTVSVFYGDSGGSAEMRYEHSGYCVVQVTEVVDTKNAIVEIVKYRTPYTAYAARSSPQWQEGSWSDKRGYPLTGTFNKQRLNAGNTEHQSTTYWGSIINGYLNFKDGDKDDEGYSYRIVSDKVDAIRYMVSTKRLNIFTTGGEYIAQATQANETITPTNIDTSPETSYGCSLVTPIRAGPAILFVQRNGENSNPGRRVREFVYNFQTDSHTAPDLTLLAEHITAPGLGNGCYIAAPDSFGWYYRTDGVLVAVTYERDQQVVGWHRHPLGGDGMVKSVCSIPGSEQDELWQIVERTIDSGTVRYIEVQRAGLNDTDDLEDAFFVDCGLTYDGASTTTVSGLWHLRGEDVVALADGIPVTGLTVNSMGRITLPAAASKVHVGYKIPSILETLRVEAGAAQGTAQGAIGRTYQVGIRMQNSLGGKYGRDLDHLDPIPYRQAMDPIANPLEMFNGDIILPFDGEWDTDRYMSFYHDDPLPWTATALIAEFTVNG